MKIALVRIRVSLELGFGSGLGLGLRLWFGSLLVRICKLCVFAVLKLQCILQILQTDKSRATLLYAY